MKIVYSSAKEGIIKLKPETLDDLWYLKGIIAKGDLVSGRSYRRIKDEEKLRSDKGTRVAINLSVRVENVEYSSYITNLRVTGKIEAGPEDLVSLGSYHTIEVAPHDVIAIKKERWKNWELERLREAERAAKTPIVLILCLEEGEAEFAVVRRYGIDYAVRVTTSVAGKRFEKEHEVSVHEFYGEVAEKMNEVVKKEKIEAVVICGPGFTKENLFNYLKEKNKELVRICTVEQAGSGGRAGVQEVIKRGVVERVAKNSRVSLETKLVEKVFEEIGKSTGLAAYGMEEVKKALDYGAVEKLLVTEVFLRKSEEAEKLIERAKHARGEAVIVSAEHEVGEKLEGIGGIAALLRFRVT